MAGLSRVGSCGGRKASEPGPKASVAEAQVASPEPGDVVGFDRNDYPGDEAMAGLRKQFAYTGYWLTPPPGETTNGWGGKRTLLREQGYGFLVLANGRLDKEIKASKLSRRPGEAGRGEGDSGSKG